MFTCSDERTLHTKYVMTQPTLELAVYTKYVMMQLTLELAVYTKYVMMQPTLELAVYTKYVMMQPTLGTSFVYEVYKYIAIYELKMKNDKKNTGGQKHAGNYFRCNSLYWSG